MNFIVIKREDMVLGVDCLVAMAGGGGFGGMLLGGRELVKMVEEVWRCLSVGLVDRRQENLAVLV
jgi:hypothetical protein